MNIYLYSGQPLLVGMDLTIASFDAISEVNMVRNNFFFTYFVSSVSKGVCRIAFVEFKTNYIGYRNNEMFDFQDYTITMYLNQYWKDERLAFSNDEEILTLSGDFAEKIWVPDTFFANDKNRLVRSIVKWLK